MTRPRRRYGVCANLAASVAYSSGTRMRGQRPQSTRGRGEGHPKRRGRPARRRILFYYHIGGILAFTGPAIWVWRTPVGTEWLLLIAIGVVTTAGMVCYIRAFSVGEANAVGPSENLRLIYAALFGYFLFAEVPSIWTGIGAAIIVASTLYIARDETRRRR